MSHVFIKLAEPDYCTVVHVDTFCFPFKGGSTKGGGTMVGEQGDSRRDNLTCHQIGFKPHVEPLKL
jgi:hypothetical protein